MTDLERDWDALLALLEGWEGTGRLLLRVACLARDDPRLGLLYPFTSLNRLCFARERGEATNDCPAIGVDKAGIYSVVWYPYERGFPNDNDRDIMPDTSDPELAVALASEAWRFVKVG